MDGLILGLDLCDAYTQLVCDQGEKSWTLPTVICRKKEEESWMVGEPAYASALAGSGVMVDKLVKQDKTAGIFRAADRDAAFGVPAGLRGVSAGRGGRYSHYEPHGKLYVLCVKPEAGGVE